MIRHNIRTKVVSLNPIFSQFTPISIKLVYVFLGLQVKKTIKILIKFIIFFLLI
jgi:hypothetical protein